MKKLLFSLFLIFQIGFLPAQEKPILDLTEPLPVDENVKIGQLKNGLTYYLRKNNKPENKIEFRLVVKAGSILEDEDQRGLAHFIEHMAFNGSEHFEKNELVNYLQSIGVEFGADLNAYTSFDETVYMLPIPTEDPEIVEKGLLVLRDWAGGVTFDNEEIDKERGVVLEEWRLGRGADQRMRDEWFPLLFKDSKYAVRLPIGSEEVIQNADYETVKRFYKDWYRPDLMAVVAVGDLEPDEMEKQIKKVFGNLKNPKKERPRVYSDVPDHKETYVSIAQDEEAAFTRVSMYYKHDAESTIKFEDYKRDLIYSIYGDMINQRLDELRRQENPPFIGAGVGYGEMVLTKSVYYASATVGEDGVLQGLNAVATENERVKRFGFTEGELERAKASLIKGYERALKEKDKTESGRYVREYMGNFLEEEPIPGIDFETAFVQKIVPQITLEEVNSLAKAWISDENRVVIVTGPEKEGVVMPTEQEILAVLKDVEQADIEPYDDGVSGADLMASKPKAGSVVSTTKNETVDLTEWTLSNGMKVAWKKTDFKNDQILMAGYSWGGTSLYSDEDYHSAGNASTAVSQGGVGEFSPTDLEKMLSGKVVNVSQFIGELQEGMNGSASPEDLETLFQLIYLHFTAPRKDAGAFNSYINRMKMILPNIMSNPNYFFQDAVANVMSQGHLRGGGIPTVEDLEKVDFDRAFEIYQERFANAGDFKFVFVGAIDEAQLKSLTETYLASLPATDDREEYKDVGVRPPSGKVIKTFNKGKDPKSSVRIYYEGTADYDFEARYHLSTLGDILSNRLIDVIREEKSGVYGVGANGSMEKNPYESYSVSISFPCGPENTESLIADVLAEVEKMKTEGPTQEELDEVLQAHKQNRKEGLEKNGFWLNSIRFYDSVGADLDKFYSFDERVNSITVDDVKAAAQKFMSGENYIQLVLMPEEGGE